MRGLVGKFTGFHWNPKILSFRICTKKSKPDNTDQQVIFEHKLLQWKNTKVSKLCSPREIYPSVKIRGGFSLNFHLMESSSLMLQNSNWKRWPQRQPFWNLLVLDHYHRNYLGDFTGTVEPHYLEISDSNSLLIKTWKYFPPCTFLSYLLHY